MITDVSFSKQFSVSTRQFLEGLLYAVGGGVWAILAPSLLDFIKDPTSVDFNIIFNWTSIWHTAVATGGIYIGTKFFSGPPRVIQVDSSKTSVVDKNTKEEMTVNK